MPGILHKARQPNWPDEPFIEGAMKEQETSCAARLREEADRDAWR